MGASLDQVSGAGRAPLPMRRPRVKPEHAPYRIQGGLIRIGGVSYGVAAEVRDPTGMVWTLLESMDGSRDADAVVARVTAAHPGLTADAVSAGIAQFAAAGYLEDLAAPEPAELTARDLRRYGPARSYYRWLDLTPRASTWEPQVLLGRARVTVVGIGGSGGVAALALAASGVGRLHLVDPDVVELSNLCRQVLYTEDDLGRPKVDAALARLRALNSDIEVTGEQSRIDGVGPAARLAGDCDVLLLTADRPPQVRVWTNLACLAAGRPWVDAGYHGPLVQVGTYRPGGGACWQCVRLADDDRHAELGAYPQDGGARGAAVGNAVAAPSAGVSGYLAAHEVIGLITGIPPAVPGRVQTVNLAALDAPLVRLDPRRADCPACAAVPPPPADHPQ
ncbi:HesA/MoeB/ThiF family protein [Rugosimonospora africana]|uniref:THIF-type NAD/FAD binding fold domain-containing protein n=1 Tax=Rugosimonospora africana TaxID=556532 RepID=A0A8J3R1B1_9ACTN|nr:ThiF family adenylyltransferase [Rugosimonospora africana]GIH19787.1 hypothetical protein Raf01_79590 [Rugosimonospora africana]